METTSPYLLYLFYFILLVIGFGLGLLTYRPFFSKRDAEEAESGRQKESIAYIKGVNYILSDAPDLAIEEFIKAVQINSDTVETYLALGNLFRSKGEVARATRIHQGIIVRPNIDSRLVIQAMYDLGLDYKKAGFINRAISSFENVVERDPQNLDTYRQLKDLYEEIGEWKKAYSMQQRISHVGGTDDRNVLAHLLTEHGKVLLDKGDLKDARKAFKKAISTDPGCVDAYLHYGDLQASEGNYSDAVSQWKKVMDVRPNLTYLAYHRLEDAFFKIGKSNALEDLLRLRAQKQHSDYFTHLYLAKHLRKKAMASEALKELRRAMELNPHSPAIRTEVIQILLDEGKEDEAIQEYADLIKLLTIEEKDFQCYKCGYQSDSILWKCPQCLNWDTISYKHRTKEEEDTLALSQGS